MESITLFENLKSLEIELSTQSIRKNSERISMLLADDFCEFGKSGRVFDKASIIQLLKEETPYEIQFSNFKFKHLSENVVLLTYQAFAQGIYSNRSSVWCCDNDLWKLSHHQGTYCPQDGSIK